MTTQSFYTPLGGGMDLITPFRQLKPGQAVYAVNYECPTSGGYRRVDGYTQVGPAVPGEGPTLGVVTFIDDTYAIRKDVGLDSATLYIYNSGTDSWDTVGTSGVLANGRHQFDEGNFLATSAGRALYLVGGGKPFELKGGTLTELSTAPSGAVFIAIHRDHLFLGFEAGSVQHSSLGDPTDWDAGTGTAGEIGTSQRLTNLVPGRGGVLHLTCRDSVKTLFGTSVSNWELRTTLPNSGAKAYSGQPWLDTYFVGERGIASLQATDRFGDFLPLQPGAPLEPLFTQDGYADRVVCTQISKKRAQYRVFFDDGSGVYLTPSGLTLVNFPNILSCAHSAELESGEERLLYGIDDGTVMKQVESGQTFNGQTIAAFLTLAFNDLGRASLRKRFRRAFFDIRSGSAAQISVTPDFDFGSTATASHRRRFVAFLLGGGLWNVAQWDNFVWSAPIQAEVPVDIAGTASSINFAIYSDSPETHEILGYDLQLTPRRQRRG